MPRKKIRAKRKVKKKIHAEGRSNYDFYLISKICQCLLKIILIEIFFGPYLRPWHIIIIIIIIIIIVIIRLINLLYCIGFIYLFSISKIYVTLALMCVY